MKYLMFITVFAATFYNVTSNAQIVPHHASYTMSLVKRSAGEGLTDLSGTASFMVNKSCDTWVTNHNADINYYYAGRNTVRSRNTYSSLEALGGQSLIFASEQSSDGQIEFSSRGKAVKTNKSHLDIQYNTAPTKSDRLDGAFVFPIHHTEELIKRAMNGDKMYRANLYDGGEKDQYYSVNAAIGKMEILNGNMPAWPVSMSFYLSDDASITPEYEMHFRLRQNGVIKTMDIAYPNFTVSQTMTDLKLLEIQACD
jgi:hypothetical protein